jgi:hypothetical protein
VGFVVDKVVLGQVFSEYFGFPCQSLFHQLLHNHPHPSSGACTIGQKWRQYLVDIFFSPTPRIIKSAPHFVRNILEPRFEEYLLEDLGNREYNLLIDENNAM